MTNPSNRNVIGIYCSRCGKWFKWADKDEKNLQLKNPNITEILDKISAEIDEKISHYDHFENSNTANGLRIAREIVEKHKED